MRKILKFLLYLSMTLVLAFISLVVIAFLGDYKPDEKTLVYSADQADVVPVWAEIDILTWNIGYGGLSKDMDFFYDGGENVRPAKAIVERNIAGVIDFLKTCDTMEYILLQEVDKKSKRSYQINEYDEIEKNFPGHWSYFGMNYDVFYVPIPITDPMGKVNSGLQTLSRQEPVSVFRYSFPGNYPFPKNLFMLDRCFMVNTYQLNNGKELLIINTHNSAYDDGSLRKMQMLYLKKFLETEFQKGNYIIVGGDWNQSPPDFKPEYTSDVFDDVNLTKLDPEYLPSGWSWVYDGKVPTNRRVMIPYKRGETPTTVIDFFLVSPNIRVHDVRAIDLGFEFSDHQPVLMKIFIEQQENTGTE
jgi:endonuclease/exonuclease/phosphatase family metal-dependent hydrolase